MMARIRELFGIVRITANSAGDTISPREAVDLIQSLIDDLKSLIVDWEEEEKRRNQRLTRKRLKRGNQRLTRKR